MSYIEHSNRKKYFSTKRTTGEKDGREKGKSTTCRTRSLEHMSSSSSESLIEHLRYSYKPRRRRQQQQDDDDKSSTPPSEHSSKKQPREQPQQDHNESLEFLLVPKMGDEEESPTSVMNMSSPLKEHMNKLLNMTAKEISGLVLVPDNARLLPPSFQVTPVRNKRNGRPLVCKSLSDRTVMNKSKYRPCRWTSDASSPRTPEPSPPEPYHTRLSSSVLLQGPPPPPPFMSPVISSSQSSSSSRKARPASPPLHRPLSISATERARNHHRPTSFSSPSSTGVDTRPVLPSRSDMDVSEHRDLPTGFTAVRRPNHVQLCRQTSDSVLARPERRDSDSEEFSLLVALNQIPSLESMEVGES